MAQKKLIHVNPDGSNFGEALRQASERVRKELPIEVECPKCGNAKLHEMSSLLNGLFNIGGVCPKCIYTISFTADLDQVIRRN